ncbi:hypothetical protein [Spirosoma aerolatum]|uniref:hypothetical protein n=1 Tax=Spirosoma aerolatum TaxID=1211326 RepID=UPI0009AD9704|nr:hypothetical protein [Spirosoma aerolatum]
MRQLAVALLLMLLVAKVVIGQTPSPAVEQKSPEGETRLIPLFPTAVYLGPGRTHIGYTSRTYSYAKTDQGVVSIPSTNQNMSILIDQTGNLFHTYNWTGFKPIAKKLIYIASKKLAALVRKCILRNRPDYLRQLMSKGNIVRRKLFGNQIRYVLCHESNVTLFVKANLAL